MTSTTRAVRPAVAVVEESGPRGIEEMRAVRVVLAGMLRVMFEVIASRPAVQLDEMVSPSVLRYVRAARDAGGGAVVLRSLRLCFPADTAAEGAAVVEAAGRLRAVAARFEHADGGWRCVVFRIV